MKKRMRARIKHIYIIFILLICYIPIAVTVIYSFNASKRFSVWEGLSLKWYAALFQQRDLREALFNSVLLALISCILAIVIGTLGAIGMYLSNFRGNSVISYLATFPLMIPEIIMGMVLMAVFSMMGFRFGFVTLVIAHTTFCIPYILIMVSARLSDMDQNLVDAARDLGASQSRAFIDIIIPYVTPAILSGAILAFAMSFDDVVISMFVTGPTVNVLPLVIYTRMKLGVTPEINALATIILLVTIVLVVCSELISHKMTKRRS